MLECNQIVKRWRILTILSGCWDQSPPLVPFCSCLQVKRNLIIHCTGQQKLDTRSW